MMKRIFLFFIAGLLLASAGFSDEKLSAELYKKDGGAWRVFLIKSGEKIITIRLEKSTVDRDIEVSEIDRLEINHPRYDKASVQQDFDEANYAAVITTLEPVVASSAGYMGIPNNLQEDFAFLMNAYYWNGDLEKARDAALALNATQDESLKLSAQKIQVLTKIATRDIPAAEAVISNITDPAAKLYLQACLQRAQNAPETAIQMAVKLIANYPNDMRWMPITELLCAELYLDLGMTNSAEATARQTEKFYAGTNIGKEAQALRQDIKQLTEQPEE